MTPLSLLAALALAAPASAAWRDISASQFDVPPPPARGDAADRQDFVTLLDWQQKRTPQQCQQATAMTFPDFRSLFGPSGILSQGELSNAEPLLDEVSKKVSKITAVFKKRYGRERPYNEDSRVVPCADKPSGAEAYPSSHAAQGAVDACVLDLVYPERKARLDAWGKYVGDLRVISGVHHPTDVAAGQDLAASICAWLSAQPDFEAEVAALKAAPAAVP
jgi:membrane-associated phospholipid phosphatase